MATSKYPNSAKAMSPTIRFSIVTISLKLLTHLGVIGADDKKDDDYAYKNQVSHMFLSSIL
jgi:hypothetical protein